MKVLVTGGNGQLGKALQQVFYPEGIYTDVAELDITSQKAVEAFDMNGVEAIINAAAYTDVDGCERPDNQGVAWSVNVLGVANLAAAAFRLDIPFVHISTDYIFDGTKVGPYTEYDQPNPLSVYGKTKWASEMAAGLAKKHYVIRTSWVIGEGKNFVRTMLELAQEGVNPSVVKDQIGRPTFTPVLARAIQHILKNKLDYGAYNVTNEGDSVSWEEFARAVFAAAGMQNTVTGISTEEYFKGKEFIAKRPKNSLFDLSKAKSAGVTLTNWRDELAAYLSKENA